MTKVRNSNLELYRILLMLAVVAHHYVANSGVMDLMKENPTSIRSLYYYIFGAWGKVGINCFVLITGYFMCKSKITIQKFLKLLLEVVFYMFIINMVLIVTGIERVSMRELWSDFQILFDVSHGFTSCFIIFYLFIPFLNVLVNNMTQPQHKCLVGLCLAVFSGISTLLLGRVEMNYVVWFCILYLISSYIRFYNPMSNWRWGWIMGGGCLLSVLSIVVLIYICVIWGKSLPQYHFISDSNKLLAVLLSVSLFMYFKDLRIPQSKFINRIAQSCFGVLLIHANCDAMRTWLWKDFLDVAGQYHTNTFIQHSILSVLGIYIVCTIIDQLRISFIEKPFFNLFHKCTLKMDELKNK